MRVLSRLTSNSHTKRILCGKHRTEASLGLISESNHVCSVNHKKVVYMIPCGIFLDFVVLQSKHIEVSNQHDVQKLGALCDGQTFIVDLHPDEAQDFLIQRGLVDSAYDNGPGQRKYCHEPDHRVESDKHSGN